MDPRYLCKSLLKEFHFSDDFEQKEEEIRILAKADIFSLGLTIL